MGKIEVEKQLIEKAIESLSSMREYADDGSISRYDSDFKEFFMEVDKALDVENELCKVLK